MSEARPESGQNLVKRTFDIRVTIDTDSMLRDIDPAGGGAEITRIAQDQGFMVVTASQEVTNQGTGDVAFAAAAGDTLRFFISSGSNNFEQPVLLAGIRHVAGDEILQGCTNHIVKRECIAPGQHEALRVRLVRRQFLLCQSVVAGSGTGSYEMVFALYDHGEEAQLRQVGQYRWAMQLTAQSNRRTP
jgi:hypothetical protein